MLKILFIAVTIIILVFIQFAMYSAMVVAGCSGENENNGDNNEGDDNEMFCKKQMCPRCKTGKDSYELDKRSEACPYLGWWEKGKCSFFVPLEEPSKTGVLKKLKTKCTKIIERCTVKPS